MRALLSKAFGRRTVAWALLLAVIGGASGGVAAQLVPRTYQTTSRVYVSSKSITTVETLQKSQSYVQQAAASFASVATRPLVLNRAIHRLGLRTTASALARQVSARAEPDTVVIGITVADTSAARSARIANGISAALVGVAPSLTPSESTAPETNLTVLQPARPSAATSGVDLLAFIGLGAAAGLLAALIVLIIRSGRPRPPRGSWRLVWVPRQPGSPA